MGVLAFYSALVGFALGIFARSFLLLGLPEVAWLLALAFGLAVVWSRGGAAPAAPLVFAASLFLFAVALGVARVAVTDAHLATTPLHLQVGAQVTLEGVVAREPEVRERVQHLYVDTEGTTVLVFTDRYHDVAYGDVVTVSGTLRIPESFTTDLERTFNYPGYLRARGVTHTLPFATVEVTSRDAGNPVVATLLAGKAALIDQFARAIPEPQAGLGAGLLLGVKQALGDELETAFRRVGIIHIVVLSGYNVMIVAEAIMRLLAALVGVRARVVLGLLAIAGFAVMVGLTATVVRATIMAALVLIARATGRTYLIVRALCFAAAVMLLFNPYLLAFDPGFQLSFLATLGLILVAPHLEARLGFVPTRLQVREFLTATVATQLFVLPLLLYQIGEFSLVAVIVNVLVLPAVPFAMLLVFLTGVVGFVSVTLASFLGVVAYAVLAYITSLATWFAALSFAAYVVPPFPFLLVPVCYALMGFCLWWLSRPAHDTRSPHTMSLAGWTVVDEATITKAAAARGAAAAKEVPIFFREARRGDSTLPPS